MMKLSSSGLKINNQHHWFVVRKCLLLVYLITTVAYAEPADAWVIFTEDGQYLAARNLQHPHIKEQPFTRFLPNLPVNEGINSVVIRAHCSRDGFGGKDMTVQLR